MRLFITILFLSICTVASANKYYFSSVSGDDSRTSTQAQSQSTPWASISKANSFFSSLSPGDSLLFKRGETFAGGFVISRNGSSGSYIGFGAYGTGADPIITGFSTLSSWTLISGSIYEASLNTGLRLNMLTVNGAIVPPGRYPNYNIGTGGYLTVTAH